MTKLTNSRNFYKQIEAEILKNFSGDEEFLNIILSDFICFKIYAEFDLNINQIIKSFLSLHGVEPKKKEIGSLKPSDIKKVLIKRFKINKTHLSFLDNRKDFADFVINRHSISHNSFSSSISFEIAKSFLDEADEILEKVNFVLKRNGKIPKRASFINYIIFKIKSTYTKIK